MLMATLAALCCATLAATSDDPTCANPERTLQLDVVELVAGRQIAGKPDLAIVREGIEYRFSTPQNKATFERDADKYEVADGGACGRMGPLSGLGDARRYAVHDGRVFFFASDGCRASFTKEPAKFLERDDPVPAATPEQVAQGRAIMDRVVQWAGGADKLKALKTIRFSARRTEHQGGKDWTVTNVWAARFPNEFIVRESWNDSWFANIRGPQGAAMASTSRHEQIGATRTRALDRHLARLPVVMLKAYVDAPAGSEGATAMVVVPAQGGRIGNVDVDRVTIWLNGAASTLTVDKASGRPVQVTFRGRDGTSPIGESVRTFTAYKTVDGVQLPTAYTVAFDGKELPSASATWDTLEVDPTLAADQFKLTK
jgi:YHS domain-containing protein